jgi:hypothetical protein
MARQNSDDSLEVIDEVSGEVTSRNTLTPKQVLALARTAAEASDKNLEEKEIDWWDPKKTELKELRGVYLGFQRRGKRVEHAIGKESEKVKNKLITVRFNGSAQLTSDLKNVDIGTPIVITFLGEVPVTFTGNDGTDQIGKRNDYKVRTVKVG